MRSFFAITFIGLLALSTVAWIVKPVPSEDGRTPLLWVCDESPVRGEQISLFNKLNPGFLLKLDPDNVDMEKVIVQSLAGVGPDLFCVYDAFGLSAYSKSGIAWDVTDKLSAMGINIKDEVWPASYPTFIYEDRVYGFPANVAADGLWYNKDIFDKLGEPYPQGPMTWDDLIPIARRLTIRDASGRVKHFGLLMNWNWSEFVIQWGGRLYTGDGTRCVLDSPEAIAAIQFMHDLTFKYHLIPSKSEEDAMSAQGGWGSGTITLFGGGKGAMAIGGRWWLCTLRNYKGLRLGATEAPHGPIRVFRGYAKGIIINRNSPRRDDALAFLKHMDGSEYNELVNRQADALGPVKRYTYTDEYLHNPEHPEEDYNAVWRDIMNYAVAEQVSPFISGQVVMRIAGNQMDLIRNNQKSVAQAMKDLTRKVNMEIEKAVRMDPTLRERYEQLTGRSLR
ncbi:MAG: extracellular solute-binding protein [bacterium]|nr:extracellular solute-binding protein [Candidatus Sumerlaeota bacterium]